MIFSSVTMRSYLFSELLPVVLTEVGSLGGHLMTPLFPLEKISLGLCQVITGGIQRRTNLRKRATRVGTGAGQGRVTAGVSSLETFV